mmetsp:Transcript_17236/g.39839  ORF Transcript_17236/g.39839 Transcript_17236/m.39839 type:complete len:117 (-) Transcript_17236:118-468(-)
MFMFMSELLWLFGLLPLKKLIGEVLRFDNDRFNSGMSWSSSSRPEFIFRNPFDRTLMFVGSLLRQAMLNYCVYLTESRGGINVLLLDCSKVLLDVGTSKIWQRFSEFQRNLSGGSL